MPYQVRPDTGLIDYDQLEANARLFHPKLVICGGSAYPREWDYARFKKVADENNALLMADIAHISGLIASEEADSPFKYCDLVTTTTHKTLRGPRAGLIFFRKLTSDGKETGLEARVNFAVFPSCQGGPHNNTIAGIAVALKQVNTPEFKKYASMVKENCKSLANSLMSMGHKLVSDGTDNHLLLWDLRPHGFSGSKMEKICEFADITINKNSIYGDQSAMTPGGVRIGTAALTTRGFTPRDMEIVAHFLHEALQVGLQLQKQAQSKTLKDFVEVARDSPLVSQLREKVVDFSCKFPMPGGNL